MKSIIERLQEKDWDQTTEQMHRQGYAVISNILTKKECEDQAHFYRDNHLYRKTISMERYRFGAGEYKYFSYPLPSLINDIRETVYPHIAPIANKWMEVLNIDQSFPATHEALKKLCHDHKQV